MLKGIHRCGTASRKEQINRLGPLRLEKRYLRRSTTEICELRSGLERVSLKEQFSSSLFQYKNSRSPNEPGRLQSYNKQGFYLTHCLISQGNSLLQEDADDKNSQQLRKTVKHLWEKKESIHVFKYKGVTPVSQSP